MVMEITQKVLKKRLTWYGHVMRRENEHINRKVLE